MSLTESVAVFVVVLCSNTDAVTDTVGPFWDESTAEAWAKRVAAPLHYRWTVKPLTERDVWTYEHRR